MPSTGARLDKAIRTAAQDPEIAARLRRITPREYATDDWLGLLDEIGALDAVRAGEDPGFCQRLIDWNSSWGRNKDYPERWVRLMESPGARPEAVVVDGGWLRHLPADLFDLLVANGTKVTIKESRHQHAQLGIGDWSRQADRRDLTALVNDEVLAPALVLGVLTALRNNLDAVALIASAGTRQVCLETLIHYVDGLEAAAAPGLGRLMETAAAVKAFRNSGDQEFDDLLDRIDVILADTEQIVADNLRLGFPEELSWPAFEEANAAANQVARRRWGRSVSANWPYAIVTEEKQAWLAAHDTVTPLTNWTGHEIDTIVLVGDEIGVAYRDSNWQHQIQWSGDRTALTPTESSWAGWTGYHLNLPVEAGRLHADGLSRPGEARIVRSDAQLFHDGTFYWRIGGEARDQLVELDPTTGRTGRTSSPDWFAEQQRRHPDHTLSPASCQLLPVTQETAGSLFSTAQGFHIGVPCWSPRGTTSRPSWSMQTARSTAMRGATDSLRRCPTASCGGPVAGTGWSPTKRSSTRKPASSSPSISRSKTCHGRSITT